MARHGHAGTKKFGTAWHARVRHARSWHGTARPGTARHAQARPGTARPGTYQVWPGTARCHGLAQQSFGTAWHDTAWHGTG